MFTSDTLLAKAKLAITMVKLYVERFSTDEAELDYAAYSVQQSIEFSLKHIIEMNGLKFPHDHNVTGLLAFIDAKCDKHLSDGLATDLGNMSALITDWGIRARYTKGYLVYYKQLAKGIELADRVIEEAEQMFSQETCLTNEFGKR